MACCRAADAADPRHRLQRLVHEEASEKSPSKPPDVRSADGAISLDDFYAIPDFNRFIFLPARKTWPKDSVDCILPKIQTGGKRNGKFVKIKPSDWLKQHTSRRASHLDAGIARNHRR